MASSDSSSDIVVDIEQEDYGYQTAESQATDTTSICSSLNEYLVENGRRYHAYYGPDKNLQPTDEIEQERLGIYHEILLLITGGQLHRSPLGKEVHRVLDIGTGTGIWAVDFATEHPEAEVIGLDLSPIQPNWVPPNCRFEVDDFELEWTYKPDLFDFVHGRSIILSMRRHDTVFSEAFKHIRPGGWFEVSEFGAWVLSDDNTVPADWPPKTAMDLHREAYPKLQRALPSPHLLSEFLTKAGFVNVQTKTFKMPLSPWPKDPDLKQAGYLAAISAEATYLSYGLSLYSRVFGMTTEQAHDIAKRAGEACLARRTTVHGYIPYYLAYGQKPVR